MEVDEIAAFGDKLKNLPFKDMNDPKIMYELTSIFVILGDIFKVIRLPSGVNLGLHERKEYEKAKSFSKEVLTADVRSFNDFVEALEKRTVDKRGTLPKKI